MSSPPNARRVAFRLHRLPAPAASLPSEVTAVLSVERVRGHNRRGKAFDREVFRAYHDRGDEHQATAPPMR